MARVVERDATRSDAPGWLLEWAELGWVPGCSPAVIGRSSRGEDVLRFVLVAVEAHATQVPPVPTVPPFRVLPRLGAPRPA